MDSCIAWDIWAGWQRSLSTRECPTNRVEQRFPICNLHCMGHMGRRAAKAVHKGMPTNGLEQHFPICKSACSTCGGGGGAGSTRVDVGSTRVDVVVVGLGLLE